MTIPTGIGVRRTIDLDKEPSAESRTATVPVTVGQPSAGVNFIRRASSVGFLGGRGALRPWVLHSCYGRYSAACRLRSGLGTCRRMIPTTSRSSRSGRKVRRCPSGVPPGHACFANVSFTITTAELLPASLGRKARPAAICMLVIKRPGSLIHAETGSLDPQTRSPGAGHQPNSPPPQNLWVADQRTERCWSFVFV